MDSSQARKKITSNLKSLNSIIFLCDGGSQINEMAQIVSLSFPCKELVIGPSSCVPTRTALKKLKNFAGAAEFPADNLQNHQTNWRNHQGTCISLGKPYRQQFPLQRLFSFLLLLQRRRLHLIPVPHRPHTQNLRRDLELPDQSEVECH